MLTAAKLIGEIAGVERFATDAKLARTAGSAPIPASSGERQRHRLDRGGNRQLNCALHRLAVTKGRLDPETAAYLARKQAEGKTRREAIRCLKRHLARRVWHLLQPDPATTIPTSAHRTAARARSRSTATRRPAASLDIEANGYRSCLEATAMVLDLHPIGSSRAASLCLCTERNASGQVALPWVVAKRAPRRHRLRTPAFMRERARNAVSGSLSGRIVCGEEQDPAGTSRSPRNTAPRDPWVARSPR